MRLAIIGLGPKGLFALERLVHHVVERGVGTKIELDVYEPNPVPGAGPVYDPDQPAYLRMNFRAEQVNLWPHGCRAIPRAQQLSFVQWRATADDPYPPRAQVGRYLADGLNRLLRHTPDNIAIRIVPRRVTSLRRRFDRWLVETEDVSGSYEAVLIATGHEELSDDALACFWRSHVPLIPAVFPTAVFLSEDRVAPGSVVATRGFALSFIDAALALTEGRGGRFEPFGPGRLRYVSGGDEPRVLIPYSRTGRPMLAKPAQPEDFDRPEIWTWRDQITALPDGFSLKDDLLPIVGEAAAAGDDRAISAALIGACDGMPPATALTPEQELRQSVAIALGQAAPDPGAALGSAWRGVYPALVARLGGDGLKAAQWPDFRRLAVNMERLAFGPSPTNAMKLLALCEAGRVDLSHLRAPDWCAMGAVDVVVDTVLPPPGALKNRSPLIDQLLTDGHVRIPPHRRGIEVLADCGCIGQAGSRTPGLSAVGRPTEDSVIGNDTLSRTLHPGPDLWASHVVATASRPDPAPVT